MEVFAELKKNTKRIYETAYKQFVEWSELSENDIKSMNTGDLSRKVDLCFESSNYKPGTIITKIVGVRTYILKRFYISLPESITTQRLNKFVPKKSNKPLLSLEEVNKLEEHFLQVYHLTREYIDLRNYIIFRLLAGTTQRIGDILKIRVKNAIRPTIHFKQEKTGREVFLQNPCLEHIIHYVHTLQLPENHYLFRSPFNYSKTIGYSIVYQLISTAGKAVLKRPKISPHCFRKYGISKLSEDGLPLNKIQDVSGHADLNTLNRYIEDKEPVKNLTGRLLGNEGSSHAI